MTKYIIKNCPACRPYDVFGRDNEGCCYLKMEYCKDVDDCVMKQIVEKCGEYWGNDLTTEVLSMLEKQECE